MQIAVKNTSRSRPLSPVLNPLIQTLNFSRPAQICRVGERGVARQGVEVNTDVVLPQTDVD